MWLQGLTETEPTGTDPAKFRSADSELSLLRGYSNWMKKMKKSSKMEKEKRMQRTEKTGEQLIF